MEAKFEVQVLLDDEVIVKREFTVKNGEKEVIKQALIAGMEECGVECMQAIIDQLK